MSSLKLENGATVVIGTLTQWYVHVPGVAAGLSHFEIASSHIGFGIVGFATLSDGLITHRGVLNSQQEECNPRVHHCQCISA